VDHRSKCGYNKHITSIREIHFLFWEIGN
jgi:hypothetical protein